MILLIPGIKDKDLAVFHLFLTNEKSIDSPFISCNPLFTVANAIRNQEGVVSQSRCYFTNHVPVNTMVGGPEPLKLRRILDMVRIADFSVSFGYVCTEHV